MAGRFTTVASLLEYDPRMQFHILELVPFKDQNQVSTHAQSLFAVYIAKRRWAVSDAILTPPPDEISEQCFKGGGVQLYMVLAQSQLYSLLETVLLQCVEFDASVHSVTHAGI